MDLKVKFNTKLKYIDLIFNYVYMCVVCVWHAHTITSSSVSQEHLMALEKALQGIVSHWYERWGPDSNFIKHQNFFTSEPPLQTPFSFLQCTCQDGKHWSLQPQIAILSCEPCSWWEQVLLAQACSPLSPCSSTLTSSCVLPSVLPNFC